MRLTLTGGIATGKSTVARTLSAEGIPTVDADALSREAVAPGSAGLRAVTARFGASVLDASGALDRAAVARIVFADAAARHDLERIVHPFVRAGVAAFFDGVAADGPPGVAEVPLAYETGWASAFDVVIVVACAPATQLARLVGRDGLSVDDARARLQAQWPIEDKARLADIVVMTDGDLAATERQAVRLARWIRARRRPS